MGKRTWTVNWPEEGKPMTRTQRFVAALIMLTAFLAGLAWGDTIQGAAEQGGAGIVSTILGLLSGRELWTLILTGAFSIVWGWVITSVLRRVLWGSPPYSDDERHHIRLTAVVAAMVPFVVGAPLLLWMAFGWPLILSLVVTVITGPMIGGLCPGIYDLWWGWVVPTGQRFLARKVPLYRRNDDGEIERVKPDATRLPGDR